MPENLENPSVATGLEKVSFHSNSKERLEIIEQLNLFHMLGRLCSKSFKLGFSSTLMEKLHMYKLDLEKAEEPEIILPTSAGS